MAIKERASGLFGRVQGLIDRVVNPETRSQFYSNVSNFANEQPILATFLAIQVLLSATPILIFASFTIGTVLLSLVTAALFSLFWVGVALLVLVPTLFITVSLGIAIWIWLVSSFLVARWVYNAMPINVKGKTEVGLPNGKKIVVTKSGEGFGDVKGEVRNGN